MSEDLVAAYGDEDPSQPILDELKVAEEELNDIKAAKEKLETRKRYAEAYEAQLYRRLGEEADMNLLLTSSEAIWSGNDEGKRTCIGNVQWFFAQVIGVGSENLRYIRTDNCRFGRAFLSWFKRGNETLGIYVPAYSKWTPEEARTFELSIEKKNDDGSLRTLCSAKTLEGLRKAWNKKEKE